MVCSVLFGKSVPVTRFQSVLLIVTPVIPPRAGINPIAKTRCFAILVMTSRSMELRLGGLVIILFSYPGGLAFEPGGCIVKKVLLLFLFLYFSVVTAGAEQITIDYRFEEPLVEEISSGNDIYHRINMPGAASGGQIGQPRIPVRGAQILLPPGTDVANIEIKFGEKVLLVGKYQIEPVGAPSPFSKSMQGEGDLYIDAEIYASNNSFPSAQFEMVGIYGFRGYRILVLRLYPLEYEPLSGKLYYYPVLTVEVSLGGSNQSSPYLRNRSEDIERLSTRVDNPEMADSYGAVKADKSNFDFLIITTPELADAFVPLKEYHDANGMATAIHTTADIGGYTPNEVRGYISDRYTTDGISYVLIGGDIELLPAQWMYVKSWDGIIHGDPPFTDILPSDIYFACLDGVFNYDGDQLWGEPTDGSMGGDVDLMAEVFVGRASVGNVDDVSRFVSKTIQYLSTYDEYLQDVLVTSERLGFGGPVEYGAIYMEEVIDGSDMHGYTTVGIPSSTYDIDVLSDFDWPGTNWPSSEVVSRINGNLHFINHLGHSNYEYSLKMYKWQAAAWLTNDKPCFIYNQGCMTGQFDTTDCWAETVTSGMESGAFATIGNARFGYGSSRTTLQTTDSPAQRFNREFLDALFNPAENKRQIGRANQDSKEDNLYRIEEPAMRWTYYQLNLFGDPTVAIKTPGGITFDFPGGIPDLLVPNATTTLEVVAVSFGEAVPVPGSGLLHYSIDSGPVQTSPLTEISGNVYEATLPAIECGQMLEFYVSVDEAVLGRQYDTDPESAHRAVAATSQSVVFEDDFESFRGWAVSGGEWDRGIPQGGGGEHGGPDPSSAFSGSSVIGYNLLGDYINNMPEYHLTSPVFDASGLFGLKLHYMRWLGVEEATYDHAYIHISNDGNSWFKIWENSTTLADTSWNQCEIDISGYADSQSTVYLRWTMGTTDGGWSYCGWNIDNVKITGYECRAFGCGDANGDQSVNLADAGFIVNYIFYDGEEANPPQAGDANGDQSCNLGDAGYIINYIFYDGGAPVCPSE